tara:strand:- start:158 stop:781 length:624 start_codon:yes stop_codon:yes gene_type:complete
MNLLLHNILFEELLHLQEDLTNNPFLDILHRLCKFLPSREPESELDHGGLVIGSGDPAWRPSPHPPGMCPKEQYLPILTTWTRRVTSSFDRAITSNIKESGPIQTYPSWSTILRYLLFVQKITLASQKRGIDLSDKETLRNLYLGQIMLPNSDLDWMNEFWVEAFNSFDQIQWDTDYLSNLIHSIDLERKKKGFFRSYYSYFLSLLH